MTQTQLRGLHHPAAAEIDLARVLRAVGEPLRLELVRLLDRRGEAQCNEIASALEIPDSTASYHMRLLREAGVTRSRADGAVRHVSLRRSDLDERFPGLLDVLIGS